jgi:titin
VSGPTVTLSSATAQKPTFVPPNLPFAGGATDLVFQLTVNDGFSTSDVANVTVTLTPVPEVPGAPSGVSAVGRDKSAIVSFSQPFNGGSSILIDVATCTSSNGGAKRTVFAAPPSVTVTGLTNGATYTCSVAAVNAVGTGPASSSAPFLVAAPPAPPTNVTVTNSNTSATVSFVPGATGGDPAVTYVVACSSSNGGMTRSSFFSGSPATLLNLTAGKTYTCSVFAAHAEGTSAASASAPLVIGVPFAPTGVTAAKAGGRTATVKWTAPGNNGSAITGYIVIPVRGGVDETARTFDASTTTRTITGLVSGGGYYFKVQAVNARGTGPASALSNGITVS